MARIPPHARVIAASLIALVAGGAVGAVVIGSSDQTRTVTVARLHVTTAVRTIYKTRIKTVAAPAPPTASAHSSGSRPQSSPAAGSPPIRSPAGSSPVAPAPPPGPSQHFAGTGPTTLGDITIKGTATLRWTNSQGRMRILFDGNAVGVDSPANAGQTVAPAQTYHQVKVDSPGRWTINIS